jgi:RNA polymerase sigma-70 factor (ECF subfamily)
VDDPDQDLLERLRAGDEAAFAVLVRRYQPSLLRLACSMLDSASVAEEAVQDTWLAVVRGLERFEGRSTVKTWLFHILANRARSAGRRERRAEGTDAGRGGVVPADWFGPDGTWASPPRAWSDEVEDRMVAERLAKRARACVDGLPAAQRQAVLLRDVEGLSSVEVCAVLGVSAGHLRVLLHRGRARVRAMLEAEMRRGQ